MAATRAQEDTSTLHRAICCAFHGKGKTGKKSVSRLLTGPVARVLDEASDGDSRSSHHVLTSGKSLVSGDDLPFLEYPIPLSNMVVPPSVGLASLFIP